MYVEEEKETHTHSKPIIWEQDRHQVKEVIVVFVKLDSLQSYFGDERFEVGWEFALVLP